MTVTQAPTVRTRSTARMARGTIAVLYAAGTALASFGLPSLLMAWTTSGDELDLRTMYVIWGLLAGVYIPLAVLPLVRRPLEALGQQLIGFVAASALALALAFEPENARYIAFFTVPAIALILLHPARRRLFTAGSWDRVMLAVAAVGAVPAAIWAVDNLRLSAETSYLDTMHGQYAQAGVLGLALAASAVVAARRSAGWMWVAGSTVFCTLVLGFAGLVFPEDPASLGTTGGVVALTLAAAFIAAAGRNVHATSE
jgi:peptidoglycan/LPS O-acetylase OafA/YrhL